MFMTPWGTLDYNAMPFRLMNAGATFQHVMTTAFHDLITLIIKIYFDDLNVHLKCRDEYLDHLRLVLQRCHRYGISLNLRKCIFFTREGHLLRFVISPDGIRVDYKKV